MGLQHLSGLSFLKKMVVDDERIEYIQDLFGLALIGESIEHVLPLFVGTGANGKSTILEVASGILGDYVATMPENFLLDKGFQEHSTEIARLRGCRLAIGSETRPDGKFNEARVKMLTGGDTISARMIGKNSLTLNQHILWFWQSTICLRFRLVVLGFGVEFVKSTLM